MILSLDIGGTKIAGVAVSYAGETLAETKVLTDANNLVAQIDGICHSLAAMADKPVSSIAGVGIGIPGMVNNELGTVDLAINLAIFKPLPLVHELEKALHTTVVIENDVRLAALGILQRQSFSSFAYLSIGTGVSAGFVFNDQLWKGVNNMAGEIGQLPVGKDDLTFEQEVSGPSIMRKARAAGLSPKDASSIFNLAKDGNQQAQQIVDDVSSHIGRMLQFLVQTYDVEAYILGGGVTRAGAAFFDPLREAIATLRTHSLVNARMLSDEKFILLSPQFNPGIHGGIALVRNAIGQQHLHPNSVIDPTTVWLDGDSSPYQPT